MELKVEHLENKSILIIEKNFCVGSDASEIQNTILDLIENGSRNIFADLSKLDFITSWGIGTLVYAHTTCKNKDVNFSLTGVNEKILSILKKTKLDTIFTIV
ncbi:MAG: STAS domain-containing protein [Ignavibacteriae bacterium]|nr:anti-sigma factor antagonist [Ignavibacteriota bacterium]NOG99174.1 STAS domain-containing protein [Ignavibacteriota bacterium]